jgi:hypothetical protein
VTFTDGDYGKSITWRLSSELDGKDVAWLIFAESLRTTESTAQQLFRLVLAVTPIPVGKHTYVCVCVSVCVALFLLLDKGAIQVMFPVLIIHTRVITVVLLKGLIP